MEQIELYDALRAASHMMAKTDVRYFLNGVHIVKKDGQVIVEASDGHTAVQIKNINPESVKDVELDVIIPGEEVATILKIDKVLQIENGMFNGIFKYSDTGGKFPDLNRSIPQDMGDKDLYTGAVCFNFAYLERVSKSIKALRGITKTSPAQMQMIPMASEEPQVSSCRITCEIAGAVWVVMSMRGLK